jgi:long-chain acyl-CoA synthetase
MADETLARMFWSRVEAGGDRPAQMIKAEGRWRELAWSQVGDTVRELALGLLALGRRPGEAIALLSQSRAEWVQADFAILSTGGLTVPIYPSYTPGQIASIVNDSEARTLIVEDAAQLAKALEVRDRMPGLAEIVVIDSAEAHAPPVLTWAGLKRLGSAQAGALRATLVDRVASIAAEDVAAIVYTSGTTGEPKGVVQTHGNHMAALSAIAQIPGVEPGDVHLLFLPLAHAFARLEAFMGVHRGLVTAFAESLDRVGENLKEVRPHFIFAVPRVFEKVHAKILADVAAGSPAKRRVFGWAMAVGARASRLEQARRPLPRRLALQRTLAHRLVFSKLHAALGGRLRFAVSGGAPLAREIAEFFHAAGVLIVEGYGLTETCPALTFNRIDRFKFGSVGQPLPGVQLRIAADGEILARGPNVATRGYWKQPAVTAEAFDADGWLHTGDIGRIDEEGFVYITDRKKDLIVTSGGINIAPQLVESMLRADPFISQAMVYGDRRPFPVALLTLNPQELVRFARDEGILVADHPQLARHPRVLDRVARIVEAKNAELQSYARVKKFAVLPIELSEEAGELTPTQKVKRRIVAEKYRDVLESLYA